MILRYCSKGVVKEASIMIETEEVKFFQILGNRVAVGGAEISSYFPVFGRVEGSEFSSVRLQFPYLCF